MLKGTLQKAFKLAAVAVVAAPLAFSSAAMAQDAESEQSLPQPVASETMVSSAETDQEGISYLYPWALGGLATLPILLWLLRVTPPRPQNHPFPASGIFTRIRSREETPAKTPPWQLMMRATILSMMIVGMAEPLIDPEQPLEGEGPLVLVIDNGWGSAANWDERQEEIAKLIDRAEREGRDIMMLMTAPGEDGSPVTLSGLLPASDARELAETIKPQPWSVDRQAALKALEGLADSVTTVWLSDGLGDEDTLALANRLKSLGVLKILQDSPNEVPQMLVPPELLSGDLTFTVKRPLAGEQDVVSVIARAEDGRLIQKLEAHFEEGDKETKVTFELPTELRNELALVSIEGENSAGAVVLMDERWRRRPVAIIDAPEPGVGDSLESVFHFLEEALDKNDPRRGSVTDVLERELAVMILPDGTVMDDEERRRVDEWIRNGGTVLRFAGPYLAQDIDDDLLPVRLREGDRELGGALSWSEPARIAPFAPDSPFYGVDVPENVVVQRQVMAQSGAGLKQRTWATLEDGTPIVTAEQRGKGFVVLVHTSANAEWSNLALSGLYLDMLQRIIHHSQGVAGMDEDSVLAPWQTLSGDGQLGNPSTGARALTAEVARENIIGPESPPGFYGDENARMAHNLVDSVANFEPLPPMPDGAIQDVYTKSNETELKGWLLSGALGLLIIDMLVVMAQRGMLPGSGGGNTPSQSSARAATRQRGATAKLTPS